MSFRKYLTATAAAAVLFGLSACGSVADSTDAVVETQRTEAPPPSGSSSSFDAMAEEAFLTTLDEEGINLPDAAALDAADIACETSDLFTATQQVADATGLLTSDAAFLVGAAVVTCGGGQS